MPRARPAARISARRPQRHARASRRGRRRQDRAARLRGGTGVRLPAGARRERRVGDGLRVRRADAAVARREVGRRRAAAGPAARRAAARLRATRWAGSRGLSGQPGCAQPALAGGGGAAARLHRRRCPVAGSGIRFRAVLRRAPSRRRADRDAVRGSRTECRAGARRPAGARRSGDSATPTPADSWTRRCREGSTRRFASGSSPRREATRSRCWSCRGG